MSRRGMIRATARRRARGAGATVAAAAVAAAAAPAAGAIEVNSLADPGNNNCNDGVCTLREALALADATPATADTITFKSGLSGTINLNGTAGNLAVYWPVAVQGPGSGVVTISGDSDSNGTPDTRVLYTFGDGISFSGLSFTKGAGKFSSANPVDKGGAIYMFGSSVSLSDVVVTGSSGVSGGGIWAGDTDLTISNSRIAGNNAPARGGGVAAEEVLGTHSASLIVRDSVIAGNSADYGGGITAAKIDSVTVVRSTISGNSAGTYGGGGLTSIVPATLENSTIAGNNATAGGGGGGWGFGSTSTGSSIADSTIAGNAAGYGGGVLATSSSVGQVSIAGSIIADNGEEELFAVGTGPKFTIAGSLVEQPAAGAATQVPGTNNILGSDPQLGPLADNGGPTPTMLPAPTSPAIDAGNANGLTTDQRGLGRTVEQPGANVPGSDGTDIGAVELTDQTDPAIDARAKGKAKAGKTLKIVVSSDEAATVEAGATAKAGKRKVNFKGASGSVAAGGSVTLKLKLAKRPAKLLKRAGKGKAKVTVTATDASGNESTDPLKVKLK